jgi:hypothetical protein
MELDAFDRPKERSLKSASVSEIIEELRRRVHLADLQHAEVAEARKVLAALEKAK